MRKPRRRGLSVEDQELWQEVAGAITPLHPDPPVEELSLPVAKHTPAKPAALPRLLSRIGARAATLPLTQVTLAIDPAATPLRSSPHMDQRNFDRLRKGKMIPEARLDLHGMGVDAAHGRLREFLLSAHADGLRMVLVITGKGRLARDDGTGMPARPGILRHSIPHWLRQMPLAPIIVQTAPAHARHGGSGALYVYLRRHR